MGLDPYIYTFSRSQNPNLIFAPFPFHNIQKFSHIIFNILTQKWTDTISFKDYLKYMTKNMITKDTVINKLGIFWGDTRIIEILV